MIFVITNVFLVMSINKINLLKFFLLLLSSILFALKTSAQDSIKTDSIPEKNLIKHSDKGFEFETADNRFLLQLGASLQFRFATPYDEDPVTYEDFSTANKNSLEINRARLKLGGYIYKPWLKYFMEYELGQSNLLDFRLTIEKYKWLSFKIGQWKTDYNRERIISSGAQEMMDRSILNRPFTLDRQQGISVYGHLAGKGAANFNYWISVLDGNGRGSRSGDDTHLMYEGRLQWNPLGRVVTMTGSDIERTLKPALLIAVAGATNRSPYTRFSQAGGGELEGFPAGVAGQYSVRQGVLETAFKYKGFSWQQESHVKYILNNLSDSATNLSGSYFQAGYFPNGLLDFVPKDLEVACRYAVYKPDESKTENLKKEFSVAANYFFSGHQNKLTMEYGKISLQEPNLPTVSRGRFRIQWDISF